MLIAFALGASLSLQRPSAPLLNPFLLKRDVLRAGDPLAPYLEAVRLEKAYDADAGLRDHYWQTRGTFAAFLGDTVEADRAWNVSVHTPPSERVFRESPLAGFHPEEAVGAIARAARGHRWVMVGEEHLKPQTRSILPALLRALWRQGFRTLAVETFDDEAAVAATGRTGRVTYDTGFYLADPVFAAGIREAVRLGYRLVPYESKEPPREIPKGDPFFAMNFRERVQAEHLKARVFDRDPKGKALVWAGRAHVAETPLDLDGTAKLETMACVFRRLTGEDPLSVHLASYAEQSERRFEPPVYRWATDRGLVRRPTVFIDRKGRAYGDVFDMQVFWPRTVWARGRPDWLARELGRVPCPLPERLVRDEGIQLAQAFNEGEEADSVPVDQIVIRPGEPIPTLMLPRRGRFWVRVLDAQGQENGRTTMVRR